MPPPSQLSACTYYNVVPACGASALKIGDRALARTEETGSGWQAHPMKKLPARSEQLLGVVEFDGAGKPWVAPVDKRVRKSAAIGDLGRAEAGQLVLADFIGLDTCLSVMQVLHEGLADSKYRPCPLLVKYVEAGWLGRKTQRGFYDYRGDKPVPTR